MRSQPFNKYACNRWAVALITLFTVFRVLYARHHQLVPDESYYWQWSRHLAHGYYDNTPIIAYVIHFCTAQLGDTEIGVRIGAILSAAVASAFMYILAMRLISPRVGLVTVIIANIIPFFTVGSIIMTQDPLQVALWSVTAFVVWLAIEPADGRSGSARLGLWFIAGVTAGLTTMAKLNGIMILPAVFLYMLMRPEMRTWLKRPGPYIGAVVALIFTYPFFAWNAAHGNAFFLHAAAMGHRLYDHGGNWFGRSALEFIGAQIGLISPGLFIILLVCLWKWRPSKASDSTMAAREYFWMLAVFPLVVTLLVALRTRVEANWCVTGYITGTILIADWAVANWTSANRKAAIWVSVALAVLMSGFIVLMPTAARSVESKVGELYGWREMADKAVAEQYAMGPSLICGLNYRMPSELAFYMPGHPTTYCLFLKSRKNEYMFWDLPQKQFLGHNALVFNDLPDTAAGQTDTDLSDLRQIFARVDKQPSLKVYVGPSRKPLRVVQIYRCYGFEGYDEAKWYKGW